MPSASRPIDELIMDSGPFGVGELGGWEGSFRMSFTTLRKISKGENAGSDSDDELEDRIPLS